jgi:hypothetical protein
VDAVRADGYEVTSTLAERVRGGVVAEIYCVSALRDGQEGLRICRRTPMLAQHATRLAGSLRSIAGSFPHFPGEAFFSACGDALLTGYSLVPGDELEVTFPAAQSLGRVVAALHRSQGFGRSPSIYDQVWDEAQACASAEAEEVVRAAASVRVAGRGLIGDLLHNSGAATHGDLTASNMIDAGEDGIIVIDWDKFCSVSPELDLAIAAFGFSLNCDADQLLAFQSEYVCCGSGQPLSRLAARAYALVGDITLVHDWYVAMSGNRPERWSNVWDWCLPQWGAWQKRRLWLGAEA